MNVYGYSPFVVDSIQLQDFERTPQSMPEPYDQSVNMDFPLQPQPQLESTVCVPTAHVPAVILPTSIIPNNVVQVIYAPIVVSPSTTIASVQEIVPSPSIATPEPVNLTQESGSGINWRNTFERAPTAELNKAFKELIEVGNKRKRDVEQLVVIQTIKRPRVTNVRIAPKIQLQPPSSNGNSTQKTLKIFSVE